MTESVGYLKSLEWQAKLALAKIKASNRGYGDGPVAWRNYNEARTRLRHAYLRAQGKRVPERHDADFDTTVCGIPCGVKVTGFWRGMPGGPFEPPEPAEIEFILLDRDGYRAGWLEEKATRDEIDEIHGECLHHHHEQKQLAAEARAEDRYEAMKLGEI